MQAPYGTTRWQYMWQPQLRDCKHSQSDLPRVLQSARMCCSAQARVSNLTHHPCHLHPPSDAGSSRRLLLARPSRDPEGQTALEVLPGGDDHYPQLLASPCFWRPCLRASIACSALVAMCACFYIAFQDSIRAEGLPLSHQGFPVHQQRCLHCLQDRIFHNARQTATTGVEVRALHGQLCLLVNCRCLSSSIPEGFDIKPL